MPALGTRLHLLCGLALLAACGSLEEDLGVEPGKALTEHTPGKAYDAIFPTYVELCAVSQLRPLNGLVGGTPGHAVMYLHGACRDPETAYPALQLCDESHDHAHGGVGISVNRWISNANWVAVPGRDFFLHGDLGHDERVTQEVVDAALDRALGMGIYDGLELREYPTDAPERSVRDFARQHALGTDFALTFSRTMLSVRVPVSPEQLREVVVFLNDLNEQYADGTQEYGWSGYSDNCAHALHNALAAAGIWEPKTVGHFKSTLAVPANEFLDLALLATSYPIEDVEHVFGDAVAHDALLAFGWLPGHHGAMIYTRDVHAKNDVYDTEFHLFELDGIDGSRARHAESLVDDVRFTDLASNLRWFEDRYASILAGRPEDRGEALQGDRERLFRRRYYRYVEDKAAEVEKQLTRLEQMPRAGS